MLTELRLPTIKSMWAAIAEQEIADGSPRRIERHLAEARFAHRQKL
jgi:hypothetical protein